MTKIKKNNYLGKVALIVGGASGIGFIFAQTFAEAGCFVIIVDRDSVAGKKAILALKSVDAIQAHYIKMDLYKAGAVSKLMTEAYKIYGKVDIMINNCRAGTRTSLLNESEKNWDITLGVMLKASFFLAQQMAKRMAKRKGAVILNISSVLSKVVSHESPSYHVAKAGLEQLTRYLAIQAGSFGIRVNSIAPGFIVKTNHLKRFLSKENKLFRDVAYHCHPGGKIGTEYDLAQAALFLCSDSAKFVTGQTLVIDGGLTLQEPFNMVQSFTSKKRRA